MALLKAFDGIVPRELLDAAIEPRQVWDENGEIYLQHPSDVLSGLTRGSGDKESLTKTLNFFVDNELVEAPFDKTIKCRHYEFWLKPAERDRLPVLTLICYAFPLPGAAVLFCKVGGKLISLL